MVYLTKATLKEVCERMPSTATRGVGQRPPDLTSTDQQGLKDLWRVYGGEYDEIMQEAQNALADDPEATPLTSMLEERRRFSKELLRRGMLEGDWQPYLAGLQEQGAGYARMGLSFLGWFHALGVIRPSTTRRVRAAYEDEPARLFRVLDAMDKWFDHAMSVIANAYLSTREQTIIEQQEAIRELSTPVLTLMDGMLLLPVVGVIDSQRARQITDHLLQTIHLHRAKVVVIDITGVAAMDTMVANHLMQAVEAARLMGAAAIVTGLSTDIAQSVVKLGVDLTRLRTLGDLQGGVGEAMRLLGYNLVRLELGAN